MRLVLLTASLLVTSFSVAQEKPAGVPSFPSNVELITVDAVVLDRGGRPVPGLTKDDFVVSEDGRPQAIASFEAIDLRRSAGVGPEPGPEGQRPMFPLASATGERAGLAPAALFVLLVDDVGLSPARQATVREVVERFLAAGVHDGDDLIFATTSGAWWSARLPEGREDVLALAAHVRGRNLAASASDAISEWEAYRIVHHEARGQQGGADQGTADLPQTQPGLPSAAIAGAELTQRVVDRYYQRRVCIPDRPAGTLPEVCRQIVHQRAEEVDLRRANRTRDVLAAVDRAVFALSGIRGRKALLLMGEGFLNDPDLPGRQEVAARCREANIAVYSLDVRGLLSGLPSADSAYPPNTAELVLMQVEEVDFAAAGSVALAHDTGGLAIRNTNDLAGSALRVAEESRIYYLIGYTPPPGKGPRDWRSLKVEVQRPNLTVRARKGYTLRTTADILAADEAWIATKARRGTAIGEREATAGRQPLLPAAVARALASPRAAGDIPVRAMPYVFEQRPGGTLRTVVSVEADTNALANLGGEDRPRAALSLSVAAVHRDSGLTRRVDQRVEVEAGGSASWRGWLAVNRELELPPGVVQARVVVRDEFLGRVGAVTARFVVPPATGLRLSTPILTPRVWRPREGMPFQPVLVARREFEPSGLLYCQFQVYGASNAGGRSEVEAAVELRRRNGEIVRQDARRPIEPTVDGQLIRFLSFPLDGLPEGDYELRLRVEDGINGVTQERVETFRLVSG